MALSLSHPATADPLFEDDEEEAPEPAPKMGLLARMPGLIRRPDPMPEGAPDER